METQRLFNKKGSLEEFHLKTKNNYKRERHQANQMLEKEFKEAMQEIEWTISSLWLVNNLQIRLLINHRVAIYTTLLTTITEITMHWQIVLQLWDLVEIKVKANHRCRLKMDKKSLQCLQFSINLRQILARNSMLARFLSLLRFKTQRHQIKGLGLSDLLQQTLMSV